MRPATVRRFWSTVTPDESSGCWKWTGRLDKSGYGRFDHGRLTHRVAYELLIGPIPEGLVIDHLCRVRACVNPSHMEPVTQATNVERGSRAQQTHCLHGHPFDAENTYIRPDSGRGCRACNRMAAARCKARKAVIA
jgi:hypothetical protein